MRPENLLSPQEGLADAEAMIATNLLGPVRLTAALLPLLQKQPRATVMNVTSGLAFIPLAMTPTYSATKAALHSYTESLRYQLMDTSVEVIELAPPWEGRRNTKRSSRASTRCSIEAIRSHHALVVSSAREME